MGDAQKVFMVEGFGLSAKTTGFESVVSVEWKMGKEERDRNFFKKREEHFEKLDREKLKRGKRKRRRRGRRNQS